MRLTIPIPRQENRASDSVSDYEVVGVSDFTRRDEGKRLGLEEQALSSCEFRIAVVVEGNLHVPVGHLGLLVLQNIE